MDIYLQDLQGIIVRGSVEGQELEQEQLAEAKLMG